MLITHIEFHATHIVCYMVTFFCKMVTFFAKRVTMGFAIWVNLGPSAAVHKN